MNTINLEGFKEEMEKDGSVAGLARLAKIKAGKGVKAISGKLEEAKDGYKSGKEGFKRYPKGTKTNQAAEFAGRNRKAIAAGAGGAGGAATIGVMTGAFNKEAEDQPS